MSSKLLKVPSIFVLLFFFCTSVLSAGIALEQYPETAKGDSIRTWVGSSGYDRTGIPPEFLIPEAIGTLELLRNNIKDDMFRPKVVSALVTGGNKIYFASSAKGSGKIFNDPRIKIDEHIKKALEKCGKTHKNDQRCGEIMVIASWYRQNPTMKLSDVPSKYIVSVDEKGVKNPCSGAHGKQPYGCDKFLPTMGFKPNEIIRNSDRNPGQRCGVAKHSTGGKAKACATESGGKSATPGKRPPKKVTVTPGWQPYKKPSTTRKHKRSMY